MNYDRMDLVLLAAAEALRDGRDPFEPQFIAEHNMTDKEVISLAESLAKGIDMLLTAYECAYDQMVTAEEYSTAPHAPEEGENWLPNEREWPDQSDYGIWNVPG